MEAQIKKDDRIEFRVSPEEKKMFRRAQKLSGAKTFSGFVAHTVRVRAMQIIEENERILTSARDKKIFFQAIFKDTEPNQALSDAAKKFKLNKQ